MTERRIFGLPLGALRWSVVAGIIVGVVYTLSPLTVVTAVAFTLLVRYAVRGTEADERRWLQSIVIVGIVLRVAAVAVLFATTDHARQPFGFIFPDEELFVRRSIWMRNIALGIPVHAADFIYVYDDVGATSYLYVLALLHVLFGPAQYGLHLVSAVLYVGGCVVLYRAVRPSFGRPASLLGLALLLYLPTPFLWSISVLKEPLFFAVMAIGVSAALTVVQTRSWAARAAAVVVIGAVVYSVQSIREGGFVMAAGGIGGGLIAAFVVRRPRLLAACVVAAIIVVPVAATRGRVQDAVVGGVRDAAKLHWGHVVTKGYVYRLLSPRLYEDRDSSNTMTIHEGARYVAEALIAYVAVPTPWQIKSQALLSFWPEQTVWYGMVLLAPIGILAGLRRQPVVTTVLTVTAATAIVAVALTSGNIGTLVRHRGLAVPYIVWLSALGFCDLAARVSLERTEVHATH